MKVTNPITDEDSNRVYRGGSWLFNAGVARTSFRDRYDPSVRGYDLGFRLVRNK